MKLKYIDLTLLLCLILIQLIGLLGVFSTTYKGSISSLFVKQMLYILFGWLIILALGRINFRILYDMATVVYMLNLFLLVLVALFGKPVYGAKRWLDLGPLSIQPSEFMKFSLLLFSTYILGHMKKSVSKESAILLLAFIMPTLLTLKQPIWVQRYPTL